MLKYLVVIVVLCLPSIVFASSSKHDDKHKKERPSVYVDDSDVFNKTINRNSVTDNSKVINETTNNSSIVNKPVTDNSVSTNNQANAQSVTFSSPSEVKIKNTPDAIGYAAMPSATCVVTSGVGVAIPGFGGSVSTGVVDQSCVIRENARALAAMGMKHAAIRVLCRGDATVAAEVPFCFDIKEENERKVSSTARTIMNNIHN